MKYNSVPLKVGGLVAAAVMCITAAVPPLSLNWVNDARAVRALNQSQLASLQHVQQLLVDAETGQRGYVITGQEEFLLPYEVAVATLPGELHLLELRYANESPSERKTVREILQHAQLKLAELTRTVQLRRTGSFAAVQSIVTDGEGRREMEEVRQRIDKMSKDEADGLASLDAALNDKIWRAMLLSLVGTFMTIGLLVFLASSMLRALRERERAMTQASHVSTQLTEGMSVLRRRNQEVSTLGEMSRVLQTQMSLLESLEVASVFCTRLLPGTQGEVYLFRNSADLLELAGRWGTDVGEAAGEMMEPSACWSLRRGQMHCCLQAGDLRCHHLPPQEGDSAFDLCLPLISYGEVLGLMHVHGSATAVTPPGSIEQVSTMAQAIAEQVALTLSNAKLRQVLRDQSIRDPLTGLYNRRYMEETLARELARAARHRTPLALVVADLDHFKRINDAHGHATGDTVLRAAARQMAALVRTGDVACRYGGEEFVLILPECSKEAAITKAEELAGRLRTLAVGVEVGQANDAASAIRVTASFGVAGSVEDGSDPVALFEAADRAVYAAKRAGRDRVMPAGASREPIHALLAKNGS
jgi:diguanylate cyclase (GGDEF)-like protein